MGFLLGCCIPARTQESVSPRTDPPLILTGTIALPNVDGRIDHFALDHGGRIFVCVIGNDTVEVLETLTDKRVHTITGVPHPQGVVYVPEFKKLFVGSRDGKLYVFDGTSFDLLASIEFHNDVDNLRYDGATKRVFAAYGDGETAGIAMIDAATNQRLVDQFKTGAHPESFQLESSGPRIFVNLPDSKEIAVINRTTHAIVRWPLAKMDGNFPMALDEADHRLFVGIREPPRLGVFDTTSGHAVAMLPSVADSDDLYYDAEHKRVYMPGGEGFIYVFQMKDPDHYQLLAKIPTALGGRTAGYFGRQGKGMHRFFLAIPARAGQSAEMRIYTIQD